MKIEDGFLVASVSVLIIGSVYVGGIVVAGVFTGLVASLGLGLIFLKLSYCFPRLWGVLIERQISMDIICSLLLGYLLINGSVTGLIAATSAALFVSVGVYFAKKVRRF